MRREYCSGCNQFYDYTLLKKSIVAGGRLFCDACVSAGMPLYSASLAGKPMAVVESEKKEINKNNKKPYEDKGSSSVEGTFPTCAFCQTSVISGPALEVTYSFHGEWCHEQFNVILQAYRAYLNLLSLIKHLQK